MFVYWLLGGSVRGNAIAGDQSSIAAANRFQNRDLTVLNEFRAVARSLLAPVRLSAELQTVFPAAPPKDLSLL